MFDRLPKDPEVIKSYAWEDYEPYYEDLIKRPLLDGTVFLKDWTALLEVIDEAYSRLYVATSVNTADTKAEELFNRFLDTIFPKAEEAENKLKQKLLESGINPDGFAVALRKMRTEAELFRVENLPLLTQEQKLSTRYDKIIGSQTVQWEGKEMTVVQLRPVYQKTDRNLRENAWRVSLTRQMKDRQAINDLWREFLSLRLKLAENAGFADYRSFRWKQFLRFDYTPADCMEFHKAIEKAVVPAAARVYERRKKHLGLSSIRPWDLEVDPLDRAPLKPFEDISELKNRSASIFRNLDPKLGDYFDIMVNEGLLDLENRKNKAPGGYCTEFPASKRPFIFMNAVGLHDDVQTMLHESGHAFHAFRRDHLAYYQQRQVGMEFAEVASMAMELLASPFLEKEKGGFYTKADADRALIEHLERCILFWPYMAAVDSFQHWVYEHPEDAKEASNCDNQWKELWERFMPTVDWTGLEQELMTGWQRKLHIHTVPFYYVEYGMAQLGAVQIWSNSLKDAQGAVNLYKNSLSLGGTVSLPELFAAAGAAFAFDSGELSKAVGLIERQIEELSK